MRNTNTLCRRTLCLCAALLLSLSALLPLLTVPAAASQPLDEILSYELEITPLDDATLNMTCRIRWKVLDDDSEGPLSWVKIGVPNAHVDAIAADSACIRSTGLLTEDGEAFIKIVFDRDYREGEIVEFAFSWHQGYMFTYTEKNETVLFMYTPGWFDEIPVDQLTVTWHAEGAAAHNVLTGTDASEGDAVILTASNLPAGEKVDLEVVYPVSRFPQIILGNDQEAAQRELREQERRETITAMIVLAAIVLLIIAVAAASAISNYRKYSDKDYWTGGFEDVPPFAGDTVVRPHLFILPRAHFGSASSSKPTKQPPASSSSVGSGSSRGGGCACACACACAGGGRAGCSRKNILAVDASVLPTLSGGKAEADD